MNKGDASQALAYSLKAKALDPDFCDADYK
jgi:hypothetical protein